MKEHEGADIGKEGTMEETDAEEAEREAVYAMFEDAGFTVGFDLETLSSELSNEDTIFIVIRHGCYCYTIDGDMPPPNTFVKVNKRPGSDFITWADAVHAIVDSGYEACGHCFLDNFSHVEGTIQYYAHFGS